MEEEDFVKFIRYSEELSKLSTDVSGPQNDELVDAYKDINELIIQSNLMCMRLLVYFHAGWKPGVALGLDETAIRKVKLFIEKYENFRDTWLLPKKPE